MDSLSTADSRPHSIARISVETPAGLEDLPRIREELAAALADGAEVVVTVDADEIVLPLVQLICAAHRTAAAAGRELRVEWQRPETARDLLRRAGFTRHTACPRSITGDCLWLKNRWNKELAE